MSLPTRAIHIPAGAGIDEATRPEWVEFGAANLTNENVRQNKRRGLDKRFGFTALGQFTFSSFSGNGLRMFADRDTVVRIVDNTATGYHQAQVYDAGTEYWANLRGIPSECAVRLIDLPSFSTTSYLQDVAYANGYFAVVWHVQSGANYHTFAAVVNATTGAVVSAPTQVGSVTTSSAPLLAKVGNKFFIVRPDTSTNTLKAWYLSTTNSSGFTDGWIAIPNIATNHGGAFVFSIVSLSDRVGVAYTNNSGGASRVSVVTFDDQGVLETTTINTSSVSPAAVDIAGNTLDTLWVAWNETTAVKCCGLSPSALITVLASTATVLTATTGVELIGIVAPWVAIPGSGRVIVNSSSTTMQSHTRSWTTSAGAVTPYGTATTVYSAKAAGRPFNGTGATLTRCYVPVYVATITSSQNQVIVCDFTEDATYLRPVACPAPGLSTLDASLKRSTSAGTSSTKLYMPLSVRRSGQQDGACLVEMDFASTKRFQSATIGRSTYLTGGILQYSDGVRIAEASFLVRPPAPTTSLGGTGLTGTFRYVAVYEEVDADGNWHQSGLSDPSASVSPANQTVTVSVKPLTVSSRINTTTQGSSVRIALYRTATGGEAPYYRLTALENTTSSATVTYADTIADATLTANAKLYSQPGVLGTAQDRRPPPSPSCVTEYNGMLVVASGNDVWYSGQDVSGEGIWFNPIFVGSLPEEVTALASQDGALLAFTRRGVFAIAGEPPSDNGLQGGLGTPQRLSSDVGCIEQRSVCVTSLGVFFQSERGIELLTRARTVEPIGESVQTTVASYPVVSSASLDASQGLVYIELAASESSGLVSGNGRTLVFDLNIKDWISVDRRKNAAGTADTPAQSGAVIYTGSGYRYAWMGTNARVYAEDRTTFLDADSSFVTSTWETADCKFGLQQQQRVFNGLIQFVRHTTAGLKIEVAYDGADYSSGNDKTWNEGETVNKLQLDFRPKAQGQRMRFRVTDTVPVMLGTGQGFTWIGLSLDVAPKQGSTKGTPHLATSGRK